MKSGHKIIEEALIEAVSEKQNFPFGMSLEQGIAYKKRSCSSVPACSRDDS